MRRAILDAARRRLASEGAAALSLRAVARDVGLASSAVYRYVDSRDALLTALIIEAYDSLGEAVETAEAGVAREDPLGRWLAIAHGVRDWALAHPHEYALVYGTPVPGYAAPQDTIGPATRVARVLADLLGDVHRRGLALPLPEVGAAVERAILPVRSFLPPDIPAALVVRGVSSQAHLFGAVSFELFGQRHNVVADELLAAFFDEEMRLVASTLWQEPQAPAGDRGAVESRT